MITPNNPLSLHKGQSEDTLKDAEKRVNQSFDKDFGATIISEEADLQKKATESTPHAAILGELLEQIEKIDFKERAYPEAVGTERYEDLKITRKHYLIIAIEYILEIADKNRWSIAKKHDFIYLFNSAFFSQIENEIFQKFLGDAGEKMGVPRYTARHYQFREHLFKQFMAVADLPAPEAPKNKVLINLKNGTFEIGPTGTKLRPFDKRDFLIYQLPFEYNPKAEAPIFKRYLDRVLPDVESQRVLAEFLGYVFITHGSSTLKEEKALILHGTGANGKSVFFEIVNALLGDENVSSYSLQSLTNENGYFRAKLGNRLVNYASEISGKLESSIFKQLSSGEPIEARLPYGQPYTMRQYAKLIFNVNELPKDVEHTNAFFRRFLIIPFSVTIPEHEQDKNLHTKIIGNELSGVFNWVLAGLDRLLKQKRFSPCEAAERALEQYKIESSSIKLFFEENGYIKSLEAYRLIKDLYPRYRSHCIDDGMKPFSKRNFTKQLRNEGYTVDRVTDNQVAVFVETKDPWQKN